MEQCLRNIILFIIVFFLLSCSGTSSPEDVTKAQILEIMDTIEASFIFNDLPGIMENYHSEFLHNGDTYSFEEEVWQLRLDEYVEIDFSEINIEPVGDFATVYFTMTLSDNDGGSVVTQEPSDENGDVSYFYRELGSWKICGKEFSAL